MTDDTHRMRGARARAQCRGCLGDRDKLTVRFERRSARPEPSRSRAAATRENGELHRRSGAAVSAGVVHARKTSVDTIGAASASP